MKISHVGFLVLGFGIFTACGGDGDNVSGDSGKDLFSSWSSTPEGTVLDLNAGSFGTFSVGWVLLNGSTCTSSVTVSGTQSSGTAVVSDAIGGEACEELNASYEYLKTDTSLTFCNVETLLCEQYI